MARIRYTQKVSQKPTLSEKQAFSIERWQIINELKQINKEIDEMLRNMSKAEVRELRKGLKKVKATVSGIKTHLRTVYGPRLKVGDSIVKEFTSFAKIRVATPIDGLIRNEGIATSIWNNISSSFEGPSYWLEVIKTLIARNGEQYIGGEWINHYFHASYGYEDEGLGYMTDYALGQSIMDQWKEEYETIQELIREGVITDPTTV